MDRSRRRGIRRPQPTNNGTPTQNGPVHPSNTMHDLSSSVDEEEVDVSAFNKLQSWKVPPTKAPVFDQLEADDTLAMEGPVMNDFEDYMTLKRMKTRRQYMMSDEVGSQDMKASKTLFSGLTAFISTSIYIEQTEDLASQRQSFMIDFKYLARVWMLHGGVVTQNVNNGQITHYVNCFLPIYFLRELDKIKSKMALVSPHWILDSIANNKRMPTLSYSLNVVNADGVSSDGQTRISFASNSISTTSSTTQPSNALPVPISEASVPKPPTAASSVPTLVDDDSDDDMEYEDTRDNGGSHHRMQTSAENPNFVADYFSSSRLHHLSSWKIKFQEELELHLATMNKSSSTTGRPAKKTARNSSGSSSVSIDVEEERDDFDDREDDTPIFVHFDMDAFFASVATRKNPALREKPVVISHGGNRALCPSVNYEARKLGIQNGTPLGDAIETARAAGKELIVLPYDYAEYEVVSRQAHEIFLQFTSRVHIKSVDEAVLDLTGTRWDEVIEKVSEIRRRVFEATNCTCSAGIGTTATLARFALMKAKPNGLAAAPTWRDVSETDSSRSSLIETLLRLLASSQKGKLVGDEYHRKVLEIFERGNLDPKRENAEDVGLEPSDLLFRHSQPRSDNFKSPIEFLSTFKLRDMPGIGWKTRHKFDDLTTIGEVQRLSLAEMRQRMGAKNGANLFLTARGIDSKLLSFDGVAERKTISVDLTYGVRFNTNEQFSNFIKDVSKELSVRARKVGRAGKSITIKLWVRHPDAKPTTFLGHGKANTFSRSAQLTAPVMDAETIASTAERLAKEFHVPPAEIRGFGLSLSSLSKPVPTSHSITSMFKAALKRSTSPPLPAITVAHDSPTVQPIVAAPSVQSGIVDLTDLDASVEVIMTRPADTEEAPKKDKKRLRTINALMEKALEKTSKKSKTKEDRPKSSKKPKEAPRKEDVRLTLFESFTPVMSTRVVAYTPVDTKLLHELDTWARARPEPVPVHGELLFQFTITLMETRNLEDLHSFSRKLRRISLENEAWAPFTSPIVEKIQFWMKQEFGSSFLL